MAHKTVSPLASAKKIKTTLTVKYDCGFHNHLSIRGSGAKGHGSGDQEELSWSRGIPLKNIGPDLWHFESESPVKNCEFKILLNDEIYECGDNHILNFGEHQHLVPHF